ncbi:MAG: zinc chelation protein SecC [Burkholderiales bacterium RIFCSPHIGHO2_12_FULL_61_11]|nr:MAG: zinc chelation protein SecC [Burkholderiales bacterium RIFCSPHIGHO2_12_FULL_61_11]
MTSSSLVPSPLEFEAFDELEAILDDLRTRYDETPQWEFCEGFMAAVICTRRPIDADEYLPVLLGTPDGGEAPDAESGSFASDEQRDRFLTLWNRRWNEVVTALDAEVNSLEDENCYHPEVMDIRGAVAEMPPEERAAFQGEELPAFAQVWALGFMFAVESWPEEWAAPRDKDAAKWLDSALLAMVAMTEDDDATPELSPLSEDGAPSTSVARLNAFGEAIWAVYDLRELWTTMGPRVETLRKEATPGRNDLCRCGSGKKYKKCHGAG